MPAVKIRNITNAQVSTSVGVVSPKAGSNEIVVKLDVIPKTLINELEELRRCLRIDYETIDDEDIVDDIELGAIGIPAAVNDVNLFVDDIAGVDSHSGTDGLHPVKTLQEALNKIPRNLGDYRYNVNVAAGTYSGVIKGNISSFNDVDPNTETFVDPYSFLYEPLANGRIRVVGSYSIVFSGQVLSATYTNLTISTVSWVVDEHKGRLVRIVNGPAAGEFGLIKSNTNTSLEVDFFFKVPVTTDDFEIVDRATNLDIQVNNVSGVMLFERCNFTNLDIVNSENVGLQRCVGSIYAVNSIVNTDYHYMDDNHTADIHKSTLNIGFGSFFCGTDTIDSTLYSCVGVFNAKFRDCGLTGNHDKSQDDKDGTTFLSRHGSNVALWQIDADECNGSFVVLTGASQGWIGYSFIGSVGNPMPNCILEGYTNSVYNDGTGNTFNSVDDNICLESGASQTGGGAGLIGPAGGDLDGTYPNPDVIAVHNDADEQLPIATINEGEFLLRAGNQIRSSPAGVWFEDTFIATAGQTVFVLTQAPLDTNSFALSVNGNVYAESIDFTLVGSTVTWLNTAFTLLAGDEVIGKYIDAFAFNFGSTELGNPSDGTFTDGLLPITPSTTVVDAVDVINEALAAIAPAAPGQLTSQNLGLSVSQFSAKLPNGLSSSWLPYTPGNTISNLITSGTPQLSSPDQLNRFNGGLVSSPPLGDRVYHVLNGSDADSRLIASGVGSTGVVEITNIAVFNTIWNKINARLNLSLGEGRSAHKMRSDTAGETNERVIYYDDVNTIPTYLVSPSHVVGVELTRFLDGIQYYREGTQFDVSYTADTGIFRKNYHPTAVSIISVPGASNVTVNPGTVPNVNDTFPVSSQPITLVAGSIALITANIQVNIQKANGFNALANSPLTRGINTYASGGSTTTRDIFVDTLKRVVLGTSTPWNPNPALVQGNAQVQNGQLVHGNDGDYPGHLNTSDADWEREDFSVGVQSGGTVRLGGITAAQVSSFGAGQFNIFLKLDGDNLWFDLGLDSPFLNGAGDGSSLANSIGGRFGVSGNDLIFTLAAPAAGGPYSTGGPNSGKYRLLVRFRGANGLALTSIEGL